MKKGRHEKILELIAEREISTQEELLGLLKDCGYNVTQATVSRDVKQLRLIKTLSGGGRYIYAPAKGTGGDLSAKFDSLLAESVVKVDTVFNQILIKCYTGLANAVCAAFDSMNFEAAVGTISGDDTILVIMRTPEDAQKLSQMLLHKLT